MKVLVAAAAINIQKLTFHPILTSFHRVCISRIFCTSSRVKIVFQRSDASRFLLLSGTQACTGKQSAGFSQVLCYGVFTVSTKRQENLSRNGGATKKLIHFLGGSMRSVDT